MHSTEPRAPSQQASKMRLRLGGPLAVLAVEVGVLTLCVECLHPPFAWLADSRVCTGLIFALAVFLALSEKVAASQAALQFQRSLLETGLWLLANLVLFAGFFLYTRRLAGASDTSFWAFLAMAFWVLQALAIGLTVFLAFLPMRVLFWWALKCWPRALVAVGLGALLALLTPWVQKLWFYVYGPVLRVSQFLLVKTYGEGLLGLTREGYPVVGIRRLLLIVTPQCSELESVAAFLLFGTTLILARRQELRKLRAASVLLIGTLLLYFLNAVRLYALIVVGLNSIGQMEVSLAHSRISQIVFLGIFGVLLLYSFRWCRR